MKKNLLLLLFTLVFLFILGEVGARLWAKFKNPVSTVPDKVRYTYYPYLPYVPTPNYRDVAKSIYHNSRGFRNSYEFINPKPANVYRIVCLGGSTTYSDYDNASNQEIWTGRLEYYLNKSSSFIKFEVINASAHNYTAYLNLIDYLTRVRDLQVNMVILYQGVNDLYFNGFDNVNFAHSNAFVSFNPDHVNKIYFRMNHNFFLKHSELLKRMYAMIFFHGLTLNEMATKNVHYFSANNINNIKNDSLITFSKAIEGFIGLSHVDNFQLVLLSQAYQYEKLEKAVLKYNPSFTKQTIDDLINETKRIRDKMEIIAKKNKIPFLDMNEILKQNQELFYKNPLDEIHFSKKGEDYFALNLYDFIKPLIGSSKDLDY
jgi:lysophospholipase L1-like esterase